jgi:hypothetical protein
LKAREDFKAVFNAAWTKTVDNIENKTFPAEKMGASMNKACDKSMTNTSNSYLTCKAAFLIFTLANENLKKSQNLSETLLQHLTQVNLFKGIKPTQMKENIISRILREINLSANFVEFNWTCADIKCNESYKLSFQFFFKLSAITSRVTKLGTLMVWSNSYPSVSDFLKNVINKIAKTKTELGPNEIVGAFSPEGFTDLTKENVDKYELFDQTTKFCWPNASANDQVCKQTNSTLKPSCCCDNTACNYGTLKSIFLIMKEAMFHPHFLDVDERGGQLQFSKLHCLDSENFAKF